MLVMTILGFVQVRMGPITDITSACVAVYGVDSRFTAEDMQIVMQSVVAQIRRLFEAGASVVGACFDGSTTCTWAREGTDNVPHARTWPGALAKNRLKVKLLSNIARTAEGMGVGQTGTQLQRAAVKMQLADEALKLLPTSRQLPADACKISTSLSKIEPALAGAKFIPEAVSVKDPCVDWSKQLVLMHKLKRALAQVAGQKSADTSGIANQLLISKARILHVCDAESADPLHHTDLQRVKQALLHSDDQCEHTAKHVFYCEPLRKRLKEAGWEKDALAIEIIGEAHQAWNIPE